MHQRISLHEPTFDASDEDLVLESIRSTWISTGGPFVDQFEKKFAEFVGAKHAISVCNGTIGIMLAIECLKRKFDISENFDVLMPSLTFIATANAVVHAGGTPIFVDVSKYSFQLSIDCLKETFHESYSYNEYGKFWFNKISKNKVLAILPVHIMGWLAPISKISIFASDKGIALLEDAAEALGSFQLNGEHVGLNGLASVFSFNGNKILTTGGGGMIVTNEDLFAQRLKHLSTTAKIDSLKFIHDEIGYNFRLVNILSALGCSQLTKLNEKLKLKKHIFHFYKEYFSSSIAQIYSQDDCISNNWLVNILLPNLEIRERVMEHLLQKNIQARPIWTPCHLQPAFLKKYGTTKELKNTEEMWQKSLSLPSSPHLTTEQLSFVAQTILYSLDGTYK